MKIILRDIVSFFFYLALLPFPSKKSAVLVYHSVDYIAPKTDPWRMNITPERFEEHLGFISSLKRGVHITFDDGYKNNFVFAYPLLLKYKQNLKTEIFVTTDFIDKKIESDKIWDIGKKIDPLTWDNLREMASSGIKIGSHAKTHRNLARLSEGEAEMEIAHSKKRIEEELKTSVDSFCYPIGAKGTFYSRTKELLQLHGYGYAYSNIMGLNKVPPEDNFAIKRIRLNSEDNILRLRMKLKGAYGWVDWFRRV